MGWGSWKNLVLFQIDQMIRLQVFENKYKILVDLCHFYVIGYVDKYYYVQLYMHGKVLFKLLWDVMFMLKGEHKILYWNKFLVVKKIKE